MTKPNPKQPTPDEYCKHLCLYKGTLNCDIKLKACPLWNYINRGNPKKP